MHPAASVIFFTTASGAGYGMLALLGLLGPMGLAEIERWSGAAAFIVALSLVSVGLLSSTFHLGHPERAWRALSQWRSSWLSREGVIAIAAFPPVGLFALGWVIEESAGGWWGLFAALSVVAAVLTVFCTSRIYASLMTIRQWSNGWVTPAYLVLSFATGGVWLVAIWSWWGYPGEPLLYATVGALVGTFIVKIGYWRSIDARPGVSTPGSATGLGRFGRVRQLEAPHTGDNYVTREMSYRIARRHARKLRIISILLTCFVPTLGVLAVAQVTEVMAIAAAMLSALSISVGVVMERWLFFAEATHVVTLFYGRETA